MKAKIVKTGEVINVKPLPLNKANTTTIYKTNIRLIGLMDKNYPTLIKDWFLVIGTNYSIYKYDLKL